MNNPFKDVKIITTEEKAKELMSLKNNSISIEDISFKINEKITSDNCSLYDFPIISSEKELNDI